MRKVSPDELPPLQAASDHGTKSVALAAFAPQASTPSRWRCINQTGVTMLWHAAVPVSLPAPPREQLTLADQRAYAGRNCMTRRTPDGPSVWIGENVNREPTMPKVRAG